MKLSYVLTLMGGLALFLYGMNMMSRGLEMTAGDKMKTILEKLTSNRFLAVFCRCTDYCNYSIIICNNSNGRWICKRWFNDVKPSRMDYHGGKYRNDYY